MDNKETDGKIYRLYHSKDSRINNKINDNGRCSAIEFDNINNNLTGPLEYEEVFIEDFNNYNDNSNKYADDIIVKIIVPIAKHLIDIGVDKFEKYMKIKGIPTLKIKIQKVQKNGKIIVEGLKDGIMGKETKVSQLIKEARNCNIKKNDETKFIVLGNEEVEDLINEIYIKLEDLIALIKLLSKKIIIYKDNKEVIDKERMLLEKLLSDDVIKIISALLDEKDNILLNDENRKILNCFVEHKIIYEDKIYLIDNIFNK